MSISNSFSYVLFLVGFCKKYSHSKNGPCQNNGNLTAKDKGDDALAEDAKCVCEEDYSGDYCDVYNGVRIKMFYLFYTKISN